MNLTDMLDDFKDDQFNSVTSFADQDKELPTKLVSIYDIEFNPLNDQGDTQEELEEFAEVLYEEKQIRSPLNVYRTIHGTKKYMLLGGDRRLHALLINAGKYDDAQKMVPVIIERKPIDEVEEELKILELNEHRSLTAEKEKKLVGRYLKIYRELEARGEKPRGQVRKWIASKMNIGEKKAEKYIHEIEGYQRKIENKKSNCTPFADAERLKKIQDVFEHELSTKVKISSKGVVSIYPKDINELEQLMDVLGFSE